MTNICLHINFKCLFKNVENNTILWTEGNIRLVNFPNFYFFTSKKKKPAKSYFQNEKYMFMYSY